MVNYTPEKLLEHLRSGLVEEEHYGFIVKVSSDGHIDKIGDDCKYPFYLRSCAKPLQASLLIDFGLDEFYKMTSEEIAICCASHAGEACHVNTVKGILNKIGLDESYLKCGIHKPLSKTEQNKLIIQGKKENVLQNNCSGKHTMMLAVCQKQGWGVNDYFKKEHPLQIEIKKKIYELCEIDCPLAPCGRGQGEGYPITKDGCGVPICSMPLENMVKGYLNLFFDEKYSKIKDAFVQNPYLIGGEDRLDTALMSVNGKLIAKVGAGGLIIVINLEKKEGIIVKILDCDMKARAIVVIEALNQLGWLDKTMLDNESIKAHNNRDIMTHNGDIIGKITPCFSINA